MQIQKYIKLQPQYPNRTIGSVNPSLKEQIKHREAETKSKIKAKDRS